MRTPLISGAFWEHLSKSRLISPEEIAAVAREFQRRGVESDEDAARLLIERGLLTQYQADRLLEGRARGFFFDNYRILDLLGAGGMGWVYRAADCNSNEVVALKVLLDRLKEDRGMLARFQQEARAGLLLDHPHIVRTRSMGSAGGLLYMVMDFVEGPSLLELLLRRRRLPWALSCDVARQAALGLHHAHERGLVHRDVKPQNLLIDHRGHVKLLDFGLAMMRDGEGGEEFSMAMIFGHECIGTPAFMAPEQSRDSLTADARSDVYGLGCTLFSALTGDTVFPLRNPHDVVKAHQTQSPRSVRELVPEIPEGVAAVVAKMLAKNPDDRYQSAAHAASELAKWSKSEAVKFDLPEILAERTQNALEKLAELHKSRPGAASSTTRLSRLSSVAESSDRLHAARAAHHANDRAAGQGHVGRPEILVIDRQVSVNGSVDFTSDFRAPHRGKVLIQLGGGPEIPLISERIVIGRADQSDLQIPDQSVSGRHCELHFDGTSWWINDFKSRNGTRVNGKPVNRRQIADGDVISIGNSLRLRFDSAGANVAKGPINSTRSPSKFQLAMMVAAAVVVVLIGLVIAMR